MFLFSLMLTVAWNFEDPSLSASSSSRMFFQGPYYNYGLFDSLPKKIESLIEDPLFRVPVKC